MTRALEVMRVEARFFRQALGRPDAESHALLRRRGLRDILAELTDEASLPARLGVPRDRQRLETEYLAAFEVGVPHAPVPLMECHWVRDRPPHQVMAENARFYSAFDVKAKAGSELPDHLITQLSFVELMLWAIEEREARGDRAATLRWALADFVRCHLSSWVPLAMRAARAARLPHVYRALLEALAGWVSGLDSDLSAWTGPASTQPDGFPGAHTRRASQ